MAAASGSLPLSRRAVLRGLGAALATLTLPRGARGRTRPVVAALWVDAGDARACARGAGAALAAATDGRWLPRGERVLVSVATRHGTTARPATGLVFASTDPAAHDLLLQRWLAWTAREAAASGAPTRHPGTLPPAEASPGCRPGPALAVTWLGSQTAGDLRRRSRALTAPTRP